MTDSFRLSGENRGAVRRAISSHPQWPAYRKAHGVGLESMGAGQLIETCQALSIDVQSILSGKYDSSAKTEAAKDESQSDTTAKDAATAAMERMERELASVDKMPKAKSGPNASDMTALAELLAKVAGQNAAPVDMEQVNAAIDTRLKVLVEVVAETASNVCQKALSEAQLVKIEVKGSDGKTREAEGHKHPMFERLLRSLSTRMANGYSPGVWLSGPAGSGKTHGVGMAAKALGLPFHLNGSLSMPHELLGFIDANGTYHRTPFREAYENGGVYLFDEVDGSDNSALLALNAALANGHCAFPDKSVERHPDCHVVAAANTWGLGATADYVGRAKLDAAFLDRFGVRICWDYDTRLEVAIAGNADFAKRVQKARAKARKLGLKVVISPRSSQAGSALIAGGFSEDEAAEMTYLANLTPDQRTQIEGD
jgi:cobaltochelatase CobS